MSAEEKKPTCGVVMPISSIDGCSETHWADVLDILSDAIESAGFESNLVSNADEVGIIHKTIVQNLYDNPVVVCDVSGKNPNVMFELGMRLAFDKPTVIVKDDKTAYSFDTSAIEHVEYPRDLRFSQIVAFKEKLAGKIKATAEKAGTKNGYTSFLKHFGEFTVAKLDKKEVSGQEFILEELKNIRVGMRRLERVQWTSDRNVLSHRARGEIDVCLRGHNSEELTEARDTAMKIPGITDVCLVERGPDHSHLTAQRAMGHDISSADIEDLIGSRLKRRIGLRRPPPKG